MNERIRELVKQAGGVGHDDDGNELTPALVGKGLEKFAELIVRNCVGIVADAVNHREPASTYVGKIKEHFGVKE